MKKNIYKPIVWEVITIVDIKKTVKTLVYRHPLYTSENIILQTNKYEFVSFDIFDTLVKRTVGTPENVFRLVEDKCLQDMGCRTRKKEMMFSSDRITAERKAREELCYSGKEEVTLDEIYSFFPHCYDEVLLSKLKEMECRTEIDICVPNYEIKKVFDECIRENKNIYIISDMYLPKETIVSILRKCGYTGYKKLYLSSEYKLQKRSGRLFEACLKENSFDSKNIIHIGDDLKSDKIRADKAGVRSVLIARYPERTRFTNLKRIPRKDREVWEKSKMLLNTLCRKEWDDYFCFGFECLGPTLVSLCKWIHEEAKRDRIDKLFFVSRDGYIIKKAYNILYREEAYANSYIHVSRRSLIVPQLWIESGIQNFQRLAPSSFVWTLESLSENLGLDLDYAAAMWRKAGLQEGECIRNGAMSQNKKMIEFFKLVDDEVQKKSYASYECFLEYLKQEGFDGRVAIMDVGWRGTTQICLNRILQRANNPTEVIGYYIGLESNASIEAHTFFKRGELPNLAITMLFEFFFSAPEGSTRSYFRNSDGRVYPELYKCEYENANMLEYLNELHAGAINFIECMRHYPTEIEFMGVSACDNLLSACRYPKKKEINMFSGIQLLDKEIYRMADPKSLFFYLKRPKKLKQDFYEAGWKIGFLKRLLKFPFPYYKLYEVADKKLHAR